VIVSRINGFTAAADPDGVFTTIIFKLRLPRAILLLLVGAALSGSGAAYQGLFRNPLADPFLIGVSSGAGLGAVIAMTIQWPYSTLGLMAIPLSAFLGALTAVLLVTRLARVGNAVPTTNLILAGVAVSSFTSAITSLLMINCHERVEPCDRCAALHSHRVRAVAHSRAPVKRDAIWR
jgi:iron complex transport system permease protein